MNFDVITVNKIILKRCFMGGFFQGYLFLAQLGQYSQMYFSINTNKHACLCVYIYFYRKPLFFFLLKYSSVRVVGGKIIELFQALRKTTLKIILFWFPKVISSRNNSFGQQVFSEQLLCGG